MIKVKGTKKLLLLSTALLVLSSCAEDMQGLRPKANNLSKPKASSLAKPSKPKVRVSETKLKQIKHGNSIREYIYANGYDKLVPIGRDSTVVVIRDSSPVKDFYLNYIPLFHNFCKAHGGKLAVGKDFNEVYYEDVKGEGRFDRFGKASMFYCEGGTYPFKVYHIDGWKISGSAGGRFTESIPEAFIYIKHKPEPLIETKFGFNPEDIKKFSKENLPTFLNSESKAGAFDYLHTMGTDKWKGGFSVSDDTCPSSLPMSMDDRLGFIWDATKYCKAHGGELQKDGKPFPAWFSSFVIKDKMIGVYHEKKNWNAIYPLKGIYACVGGNEPFEVKVSKANSGGGETFSVVYTKSGLSRTFYPYKFILHAGNEFYRKLYPSRKVSK